MVDLTVSACESLYFKAQLIKFAQNQQRILLHQRPCRGQLIKGFYNGLL